MTVAPPTSKPAASSVPIPKQTRHRHIGKHVSSKSGLLRQQGQVNAVRAAFKAGVKPSRIARQFGLTLSQVRKALVPDELRR
jgi:hypothetical protein